MIKKLGGTRAVLAYMVVIGFFLITILAIYNKVPEVVLASVSGLATMVVSFFFSNKATKDRPIE